MQSRHQTSSGLGTPRRGAGHDPNLQIAPRTELLAYIQIPAPKVAKPPSRPQLRDAGIERPYGGVMDEIAGFYRVELRPALSADQKVLLKCGKPGRRQPLQGVVLQILAGLAVVDTSLRG